MVRAMTAVALVLALAACSDGGGDYAQGAAGMDGVAYESSKMAMAPVMAPPPPQMTMAESAPMDMDQGIIEPAPDGGGGGAPPGTQPLMAYTYGWNFAVPTADMEGLLNAHKKACEDAGPANCYVTNSSLYAIGQEEGASGQLSMRASEPWVRSFEQGVNEGLKPFGASVYSNNRGAEELTAQIVDNEARLRSMTAHRDALQKMVEDKPGRLADLLEIQRSLAQAQGDIDARQSLLAALKLRVSMSVVNFSYQAEYAPASQSIWRPVIDAFGDFAPAFARTIGGLIRLVAAALPVLVFGALAIGGLMLGLRAWSRSRAGRARKGLAAEKSTSPAKPPA
jgi:hypothetical protein